MHTESDSNHESKKPDTSPKSPEEGYFYLDLEKIDEDMKDSFWWNHIYGDNFGFLKRVSLIHHCRAKDGDVLIHKKIIDGSKFPQINYFLVVGFNKTALLYANKDIKLHLADQLILFVKRYNRLPFACKMDKLFKNGNVKIDYTPTDWDNFSLDISIKRGKNKHQIENLEEFFTGLPLTENNPAEFHKPTEMKKRRL